MFDSASEEDSGENSSPKYSRKPRITRSVSRSTRSESRLETLRSFSKPKSGCSSKPNGLKTKALPQLRSRSKQKLTKTASGQVSEVKGSLKPKTRSSRSGKRKSPILAPVNFESKASKHLALKKDENNHVIASESSNDSNSDIVSDDSDAVEEENENAEDDDSIGSGRESTGDIYSIDVMNGNFNSVLMEESEELKPSNKHDKQLCNEGAEVCKSGECISKNLNVEKEKRSGTINPDARNDTATLTEEKGKGSMGATNTKEDEKTDTPIDFSYPCPSIGSRTVTFVDTNNDDIRRRNYFPAFVHFLNEELKAGKEENESPICTENDRIITYCDNCSSFSGFTGDELDAEKKTETMAVICLTDDDDTETGSIICVTDDEETETGSIICVTDDEETDIATENEGSNSSHLALKDSNKVQEKEKKKVINVTDPLGSQLLSGINVESDSVQEKRNENLITIVNDDIQSYEKDDLNSVHLMVKDLSEKKEEENKNVINATEPLGSYLLREINIDYDSVQEKRNENLMTFGDDMSLPCEGNDDSNSVHLMFQDLSKEREKENKNVITVSDPLSSHLLSEINVESVSVQEKKSENFETVDDSISFSYESNNDLNSVHLMVKDLNTEKEKENKNIINAADSFSSHLLSEINVEPDSVQEKRNGNLMTTVDDNMSLFCKINDGSNSVPLMIKDFNEEKKKENKNGINAFSLSSHHLSEINVESDSVQEKKTIANDEILLSYENNNDSSSCDLMAKDLKRSDKGHRCIQPENKSGLFITEENRENFALVDEIKYLNEEENRSIPSMGEECDKPICEITMDCKILKHDQEKGDRNLTQIQNSNILSSGENNNDLSCCDVRDVDVKPERENKNKQRNVKFAECEHCSNNSVNVNISPFLSGEENGAIHIEKNDDLNCGFSMNKDLNVEPEKRDENISVVETKINKSKDNSNYSDVMNKDSNIKQREEIKNAVLSKPKTISMCSNTTRPTQLRSFSISGQFEFSDRDCASNAKDINVPEENHSSCADEDRNKFKAPEKLDISHELSIEGENGSVSNRPEISESNISISSNAIKSNFESALDISTSNSDSIQPKKFQITSEVQVKYDNHLFKDSSISQKLVADNAIGESHAPNKTNLLSDDDNDEDEDSAINRESSNSSKSGYMVNNNKIVISSISDPSHFSTEENNPLREKTCDIGFYSVVEKNNMMCDNDLPEKDNSITDSTLLEFEASVSNTGDLADDDDISGVENRININTTNVMSNSAVLLNEDKRFFVAFNTTQNSPQSLTSNSHPNEILGNSYNSSIPVSYEYDNCAASRSQNNEDVYVREVENGTPGEFEMKQSLSLKEPVTHKNLLLKQSVTVSSDRKERTTIKQPLNSNEHPSSFIACKSDSVLEQPSQFIAHVNSSLPFTPRESQTKQSSSIQEPISHLHEKSLEVSGFNSSLKMAVLQKEITDLNRELIGALDAIDSTKVRNSTRPILKDNSVKTAILSLPAEQNLSKSSNEKDDTFELLKAAEFRVALGKSSKTIVDHAVSVSVTEPQISLENDATSCCYFTEKNKKGSSLKKSSSDGYLEFESLSSDVSISKKENVNFSLETVSDELSSMDKKSFQREPKNDPSLKTKNDNGIPEQNYNSTSDKAGNITEASIKFDESAECKYLHLSNRSMAYRENDDGGFLLRTKYLDLSCEQKDLCSSEERPAFIRENLENNSLLKSKYSENSKQSIQKSEEMALCKMLPSETIAKMSSRSSSQQISISKATENNDSFSDHAIKPLSHEKHKVSLDKTMMCTKEDDLASKREVKPLSHESKVISSKTALKTYSSSSRADKPLLYEELKVPAEVSSSKVTDHNDSSSDRVVKPLTHKECIASSSKTVGKNIFFSKPTSKQVSGKESEISSNSASISPVGRSNSDSDSKQNNSFNSKELAALLSSPNSKSIRDLCALPAQRNLRSRKNNLLEAKIDMQNSKASPPKISPAFSPTVLHSAKPTGCRSLRRSQMLEMNSSYLHVLNRICEEVQQDMANKLKDDNEIEWTVKVELLLLYAMIGHKPVGVNRHFMMILIHNKFSAYINHQISSKVIWDHLDSMYDMAALHESEIIPFPNDEVDYELPEDCYDLLESKYGVTLKRSNSENEVVKTNTNSKTPKYKLNTSKLKQGSMPVATSKPTFITPVLKTLKNQSMVKNETKVPPSDEKLKSKQELGLSAKTNKIKRSSSPLLNKTVKQESLPTTKEDSPDISLNKKMNKGERSSSPATTKKAIKMEPSSINSASKKISKSETPSNGSKPVKESTSDNAVKKIKSDKDINKKGKMSTPVENPSSKKNLKVENVNGIKKKNESETVPKKANESSTVKQTKIEMKSSGQSSKEIETPSGTRKSSPVVKVKNNDSNKKIKRPRSEESSKKLAPAPKRRRL